MDIYAVIEDETDGRIRAVEIDQPNAVVNLHGANPYTGATTITAGTLALGESGSIGGSQHISVADGATFDLSAKSSGMAFNSTQSLGGSGVVMLPTGQTVMAPGSLIPGADGTVGTLAFTGGGTLDILQAVTGGLMFDLDTTSDLVTVASGTLDLGWELIEFDDFTFTAGTGFGLGTYTLFSADSISGALGPNVLGVVDGLLTTLAIDGSSLTLTAEMIPGDANGDGDVDDKDASILGANWRSTTATWETGDFNNDNKVDDKDAAIMAAHWGYGASAAESASVPEPTTLVLLASAMAALLAMRRRR
jgi:autotransporter-associated beta strand protein